MKKLITIIGVSLCLFLLSCAAQRQYAIGMSETDFKNQNHHAELVQAAGNVTVYRITKVKWASWDNPTKYYYFKNGVLAIIDEGQRTPDVVVQLTKQ